jgi:NitT/TauT family transport system substrate-binding protein
MIMRMLTTLGRAAVGLAIAAPLSVSPVRAVDTVTIGTVGSPSANLWPLFIGLDKGFYTAENLKAEVVYIQSSASVIQQLSAGSLDITMSTGIVDPLRAIDQGAALALTRFEVQVPPYALLAKARRASRASKISRAR